MPPEVPTKSLAPWWLAALFNHLAGVVFICRFSTLLCLPGTDTVVSPIFITTGAFSSGAIEEAKRSNIELIDGDRLAEICIKHGLGVQNRNLALPKIDEDFFEGM